MSIYANAPTSSSGADHPFNPSRRDGAAFARPADFDPAAHPIIARHWFGIEPRRSAGTTGVDFIADLRRQHHVRELHRLGPRVLDEMLLEIGAEHDITTDVERKALEVR